MEPLTTSAIFAQISLRIIKEQELIIGPVAWSEAGKVSGFHIVDQKKGEVTFDGNARDVLDRLVAQYVKLFGKLSHEVCREAVQDLIAELPAGEVPASLK